MTICRLFYNNLNGWQVLKDEAGFPIEFTTIGAASFMAKELGGLSGYPNVNERWYICDSHGRRYDLNGNPVRI